MNQFDYDIVIVGAGAVGLAFAATMKESDYRILILESSGPPKFDDSCYDLRVNTLNLASQEVLDRLNAWSCMKEKRMASFDCIRVWDSAGGRIEFHADEIGEPCLGHVVESTVLTTSLLETIEDQHNVALRFNVQLYAVQQTGDKVLLTLDNGAPVSCRLVVGADGGHSTVRQAAGIDWSESNYDQIALVAKIDVSEPRQMTALQAFLPTGPLAFLPLADGSYSIVWSLSRSVSEQILGLPKAEFEDCLAQSIDFQLGDTRLASQIVSFNLRKLQVKSYLSGRTVLVGDAAHIIHPLAGMGVNLGLMDAAVLGEVLLAGGTELECESSQFAALRKYERWRKSSNVPAGLIMDGFDRGFRHPSKRVQGVLGMGLSLTNRLGFVKQEIIRVACGLSGDLPSLAKRQ